MLVVHNSMESSPKLAILTPNAVTAIPLSRCDAVATCARCVALRDPYCAWDVRRGVCAALHTISKMDSTNYLQGCTRFDLSKAMIPKDWQNANYLDLLVNVIELSDWIDFRMSCRDVTQVVRGTTRNRPSFRHI